MQVPSLPSQTVPSSSRSDDPGVKKPEHSRAQPQNKTKPSQELACILQNHREQLRNQKKSKQSLRTKGRREGTDRDPDCSRVL